MTRLPITKRELRKLAKEQASAMLGSLDLACLFGDELQELTYEDGYEWVDDELAKLQKSLVKMMLPRGF